ncbi:MAG TPA: hypothetical protein VNK24_00910 [Elusimicrobiota bacterium]|nr:hypothetical protein [Elusimicrobiota bacterium]
MKVQAAALLLAASFFLAPALKLRAQDAAPAKPPSAGEAAHQLAILKIAAGQRWRRYLNPDGSIDAAGLRLIARYEASKKIRLLPDLKAFSKLGAPPEPTAADLAGEQKILDAGFDGGGVSLGWTSKDARASLQTGLLYSDGRYPVAESSPYGNLDWRARGENGLLDYNLKASAGLVDLHSRLFADSPENLVESQNLFMGSGLAQAGRAYHAFGPLDWSWTLGGLAKIAGIAPNIALNELGGARLRLPGALSLGFFTGKSQDFSPIPDDLLQSALGEAAAGSSRENANYRSVALWGPAPGFSDVLFSLTGGRRESGPVEGKQAGLSFSGASPDSAGVALSYNESDGYGGSYRQDNIQLEATYPLSRSADIFLDLRRDRLRYGNADIQSNQALAGVRADLGGGVSVSMAQSLAGRVQDISPLPIDARAELDGISRDLAAAVAVAGKAQDALERLDSGVGAADLENSLNALSAALARLSTKSAGTLLSELGSLNLSPAQKVALAEIWLRTAAPGSLYYSQMLARFSSSLKGPGGAALFAPAGNWAAYLGAHRPDVERIIALLGDQGVWNAALIEKARAGVLSALESHGKIELPILGGIGVKIGAPTLLAAADILESRFAPPAPLEQGQMDSWLYEEAAQSLRLPAGGDPKAGIIGKITSQALEQIQERLGQALAGLSRAPQSSAALAAQVLAAVPPPVAAALQQQYGPNLAGLIPPNLTTAQIKTLLGVTLPAEATRLIETRYGPELASGLDQSVRWAGDVLRQQVNVTLAQLMEASQELDALSVDHGRKIDELDRDMAMSSFAALDAREQDRARQYAGGIVGVVQRQADAGAARIKGKLRNYGRARLEALENSPSWPPGMSLSVAPQDWPALLALYGDGAVFGTIKRMADAYANSGKTPLAVTLSYAPDQTLGLMVWSDPGSIKFSLNRPSSPDQARGSLKLLPSYIGGS